MAQREQITLYYSPVSLFADRVLIALEEAKVQYTPCAIDIFNKPDWFSKVSPLGKVPAMTYGGPPTAPSDPSPESTKLTESLALIEFIADLRPTSGLLPASPVERARMRRFCLQLDLNVVAPWHALIRGGSPDALFDVFEGIQNLLPETGFAVGAWSLADVAFAPVLLRFETAMKHEIGLYPVGEGKRALGTLSSPRFARLARYLEDVKARPSVKATFNEAEAAAHMAAAPFVQRPSK